RDLQIAFRRLDALGHHRLIADQQQRPRGYLIVKTYRKDRRRLHVYRIGADLLQVFFEHLIVLPYPSVGRIDRPRPVVDRISADRGRHRLLQRKRRKSRHLRRKIVIGRPPSPDRRDGQDEIAELVSFLQTAAFPEEQGRLRLDGGQQVHDRRGA